LEFCEQARAGGAIAIIAAMKSPADCLVTHPEARPSEAEKQQLMTGLRASFSVRGTPPTR